MQAFGEAEKSLIQKLVQKGEQSRIAEIAEELTGSTYGQTLLDLYKEYCEELAQYDDEEYPAGSVEKVFEEYQTREGSVIREINEDGKRVGFLITQKNGNNLIICEAYVKPEYRRRGLMWKTVKDAVTINYSEIHLCVYKKNPAQKLLKKYMKRLGRILMNTSEDDLFFFYVYW